MVCIAAFIILALIGGVVAIISIFKPKVGKAYLAMLKRSWGCLWKKVRLQKCETGFKDDVKNTILSRVIVKHPTWVKPLGVVIEVISVVIVVVAIWALITAVKSLLALWALGSCNVTKPSACSLGGEICSIDQSEPQNPAEWTARWFEEWGEIFEAIPEKFRSYNMSEYEFSYVAVQPKENDESLPLAVDIMDPGCSVCMISYRNQLSSGFFEKYNTHLVPFPIQDADGKYKFANSELVTRWLLAAEKQRAGLGMAILTPLFTEKNDAGRNYQNLFNDEYTAEQAEAQMVEWLKAELGGGSSDGGTKASDENASGDGAGDSADNASDGTAENGSGDRKSDSGNDTGGGANSSGKSIDAIIAEIKTVAESQEITDEIAKNKEIIENNLNIRGIPTIFYDNGKHTGLYKAE